MCIAIILIIIITITLMRSIYSCVPESKFMSSGCIVLQLFCISCSLCPLSCYSVLTDLYFYVNNFRRMCTAQFVFCSFF